MWDKKYRKNLPLRLVLLLLLFTLLVYGFGLIIQEVLVERGGKFDEIIFRWLATHSNARITAFMAFITFFGSVRFLTAFYVLMVVWYLWTRKIVLALTIAAIGFSSFFILRVIKHNFDRARPSEPLIDTLHMKYSFPSGHASSSIILAGLLIYLLWEKPVARSVKYTISLLLLLFSVIIGISRIYLRMHYASDVLAGFCLGFGCLSFIALLLEYYKRGKQIGFKNKSGPIT